MHMNMQHNVNTVGPVGRRRAMPTMLLHEAHTLQAGLKNSLQCSASVVTKYYVSAETLCCFKFQFHR